MGQYIELTAREYALLEYLLVNQGRIVSRVDIAEKVWDLHFDTNTNVIDVYINYLRKKFDCRSATTQVVGQWLGLGVTVFKQERAVSPIHEKRAVRKAVLQS